MAVKSTAIVLLLAALVSSPAPVALAAKAEMKMTLANPMRKVVNMLQDMQKKVTEEGKEAEELHKKFMCYCKGSGVDIEAEMEAFRAKLKELGPELDADKSRRAQDLEAVERQQRDKYAAAKTMAEAQAIRDKDKAAFDKELAESEANYKAIKQAIRALEKGMAGGFLQTSAAAVLKKFLSKGKASNADDRQAVLSFLSGEQGAEYDPASGEIVGLLKEMKDEMQQDIIDMVEHEKVAVKVFTEVMAAKKKEEQALDKSIMEKMDRSGELGVEIAEIKNELDDTEQSLTEDKAFIADMKKTCLKRAKAYEMEKKMRSEELVALADTIKLLNSDDALELFKKTLPGEGESFLQLQTTEALMRAQARSVIAQARSKVQPGHGREHLDFISLALTGRKVGLEKVVKMVDDLIVRLKKEQVVDQTHKEYCEAEEDEKEEKKKALRKALNDLITFIAETEEGISTDKEEIGAKKKGMNALDRIVAEATEQRKKENAEYKKAMSSEAAAKKLLQFAKQKLSKFYKSALLQAKADGAEQGEEGEEGEEGEVPAPPPETAAAYKKDAAAGGGVIAMLDKLLLSLDHEISAEEKEEKEAQAEYEQTIADSAEKRALDAKTLSDLEGAKADLKQELDTSNKEKKAEEKDLKGTEGVIMALHQECDFLLQYFDVRKEARSDEADALEKAKAILSGADLALMQTSSSHVRATKFLRSRAL